MEEDEVTDARSIAQDLLARMRRAENGMGAAAEEAREEERPVEEDPELAEDEGEEDDHDGPEPPD